MSDWQWIAGVTKTNSVRCNSRLYNVLTGQKTGEHNKGLSMLIPTPRNSLCGSIYNPMLLLLSTCNSKYPSRRFNNIVLRLLLDWSRLAAGSFPYWNWSALLTLTLSLFMRSLLCSSSQIDYWIGRGFPGASPSSSTRSPDRFKRARSLFLRSSVDVISILFSPLDG